MNNVTFTTQPFDIDGIGRMIITFGWYVENEERTDVHPDSPNQVIESTFTIKYLDSIEVECGDETLPLPIVDLKSRFGRELKTKLIDFLEDNWQDL